MGKPTESVFEKVRDARYKMQFGDNPAPGWAAASLCLVEDERLQGKVHSIMGRLLFNPKWARGASKKEIGEAIAAHMNETGATDLARDAMKAIS